MPQAPDPASIRLGAVGSIAVGDAMLITLALRFVTSPDFREGKGFRRPTGLVRLTPLFMG
ncbi:hypothetical protein AC628_38405 [Bradyrhizobium sp. NAS96.2]|nr:hypothetical protein AC628_38405 [Bradyrhizobium sp. NAS96.2]